MSIRATPVLPPASAMGAFRGLVGVVCPTASMPRAASPEPRDAGYRKSNGLFSRRTPAAGSGRFGVHERKDDLHRSRQCRFQLHECLRFTCGAVADAIHLGTGDGRAGSVAISAQRVDHAASGHEVGGGCFFVGEHGLKVGQRIETHHVVPIGDRRSDRRPCVPLASCGRSTHPVPEPYQIPTVGGRHHWLRTIRPVIQPLYYAISRKLGHAPLRSRIARNCLGAKYCLTFSYVSSPQREGAPTRCLSGHPATAGSPGPA